jgi:hypothetical protein
MGASNHNLLNCLLWDISNYFSLLTITNKAVTTSLCMYLFAVMSLFLF